jgi:hypothetical protein
MQVLLANKLNRSLKMLLNSGEFTTCISDGMFVVAINQESNWSQDGGHTFEDVTNSFELGRAQAMALIDELEGYIKKTA